MLCMLWRLIAFLPIAVFCLKGCGQETARLDVIGGEPARAPGFFAALHEVSGQSPFCGGTLIGKDLVATAAHCVSDLSGPLEVWLGVGDLQNLPESIAVEAVRVHPQYHNRRYQHDVALLFLQEGSGSGSSHAAAFSRVSRADGPLRIMGYGNTSRKGHVYPKVLQTALVHELAGYECQALGGPYGFVIDREICATAPTADSCDGDSGGPLLLGEQLYGIVSWGTACGDPTQPGVYTRAASYEGWMRDEAKVSLPIEDLAYAVFYFPLIHGNRQFTAGYHVWQEKDQASVQKALQTWMRSFRNKKYTLRLLAEGPQRYRLELQAEGGVYSTAATFSTRP